MKTLSMFLALINSLLAGLLIVYSLSGGEIHQVATWWLLTKLLAGLSIIVISILTWISSIRMIQPGLMALGSLFLVALGAGTIMWTLHLGVVTGDMEYYMFIYAGSLMMQGTASLFGYSGAPENMAVG